MSTLMPAARLNDPIAHTRAMSGLVSGLVVGMVVGVGLAVCVGATIASAGTAAPVAVVIGASIATWASTTATVGLMGHRQGEIRDSPEGNIVYGSPNVYINKLNGGCEKYSRITCNKHEDWPRAMAQGSRTVFINSSPACRKNDKATCDAFISGGSPNVFIGGETATTAFINPEVPEWVIPVLETTAFVGGLVAAIAAAPFTGIVSGSILIKVTVGALVFGAKYALNLAWKKYARKKGEEIGLNESSIRLLEDSLDIIFIFSDFKTSRTVRTSTKSVPPKPPSPFSKSYSVKDRPNASIGIMPDGKVFVQEPGKKPTWLSFDNEQEAREFFQKHLDNNDSTEIKNSAFEAIRNLDNPKNSKN